MNAVRTKRIRVLVVDDSAVVRAVLSRGLGADPEIEVVGTAPDPYAARDALMELRPDVMTLDVEMPKMDGVSFLRKLIPQWPIPTVMVSTLTVRGGTRTLEALDAGAIDYVAKPTEPGQSDVAAMLEELRGKVKSAALTDVRRLREQVMARRARRPQAVTPIPTGRAADAPNVIAIGASTGGVEALEAVLSTLRPGMPPVVITQHMPGTFTQVLAGWLDARCPLSVREAAHEARLEDGAVYIASGDAHLRVRRRGGELRSSLDYETAEVSGHRPSVDVLFGSVAQAAGKEAVGVLLTGMGRDGAEGLLKMRQAGARTAAQDEATSLIYGMPRAAVALGATATTLPLDRVGEWLVRTVWGRG